MTCDIRLVLHVTRCRYTLRWSLKDKATSNIKLWLLIIINLTQHYHLLLRFLTKFLVRRFVKDKMCLSVEMIKKIFYVTLYRQIKSTYLKPCKLLMRYLTDLNRRKVQISYKKNQYRIMTINYVILEFNYSIQNT